MDVPVGIPSHEIVRVESSGVALVGDRWIPARGSFRGNVLLLHGGGQRRHSWQGAGERLARHGWTTYAFDARGHGDSDWVADGDYRMSALVQDARAIVETVGERPVIIGASMGGMTALIGEGEHGDLARALVLVDVVARLEPSGVRRIEAFMGGAPNGFATLEEASDAIAAYNPHRPRPRSLDGLRKNLRQRADGRWYWHWDPAFMAIRNEPEREIQYHRATAAARRIAVPTLLIRGQSSDMVSARGVDEMKALIVHAESVEVAKAGHMIAGDDNDVFTARVEDFLDRLP